VALITDNSADGAPIPGAIEPYFKAAGGSITDREAVDPSSVDFTSAIERARASNPQAVLMNLYGPASATTLAGRFPLSVETTIRTRPFKAYYRLRI
jgi:ABC-type branched-subunit amino acid transport system substrate-binding protein